MAQPWLEGLAEDWISQPRSSPVSSLGLNSRKLSYSRSKESSSLKTRPSSRLASAQSQTRIPSKRSNRESHSLTGKGSSKRNVSSSKLSIHSLGVESRRNGLARRSLSASGHGYETVQHSTVQVAKEKSGIRDATPEWRERLLRGEPPMGEKGDLFSPIGLEKVFRAPPKADSLPRSRFTTQEPTEELWTFHQNTCELKPSFVAEVHDQSESRVEDSDKENHDPKDRNNEIGATCYSTRYLDALDLSCPDSSLLDTRFRTVSGLEELGNEELSPISLPRNKISVRCASRSVSKVPIRQNGFMEQTTQSQSMSHPSVEANHDNQPHPHIEEPVTAESNTIEMTSQSLPEDLSMGTQDFDSNGGFVEFHRGGYSNDGSFRRRRLSPSSMPSQILDSPVIDNSTPRSAKSSETKDKFSTRSRTVSRSSLALQQPRSPDRSSAETQQGKGSPLKLFGNYDTFTNNRLLRRIGELEETFSDDEPPSPSERLKESRSKRNLSTISTTRNEVSSERPTGSGSKLPSSTKQDAAGQQRRGTDGPNRVSAPKASPSKTPQGKSTRNASQLKSPLAQDSPATPSRIPRLRKERLNPPKPTDTKRGLVSPTKDSSPKRRKTLQNFDNDAEILCAPMPDPPDSSIFNASPEAKIDGPVDSRVSGSSPSPCPDRPRTPTPSGSRMPRESEITQETDANEHSFARSNNSISDLFDENGFLRAGVSSGIETDRKGSLTTQDFFNQASKIMDLIRTKGRPNSNLQSLNETEVTDRDISSDFSEGSSQERLSRPPSRDGVDLRKQREPRPQHPRIVSHLKKFAENDEVDKFMSGSLASLRLGTEKPADSAIQRQGPKNRQHDDTVESSPRNFRIREPPNPGNNQVAGGTPTGSPVQSPRKNLSQGSTSSSLPTGLSRGSSSGSGAKGVIASDMVAHLIPQQIGSMKYDKSNCTWFKGDFPSSPVRHEEKPEEENPSEDDPFRDIPDLSVDELKELMMATRLTSAGSPRRTDVPDRDGDGTKERIGGQSIGGDSRPHTRDGRETVPSDTSSVQSKSTRFTSSCPKPETRATSWGTEELTRAEGQSTGQGKESAAHHVEEVIQEVGKQDDRRSSAVTGVAEDDKQARVVTITFSSPLVSHVGYQDDSNHFEDESIAPSTPTAKYAENVSNAHSPKVIIENDIVAQESPGPQSLRRLPSNNSLQRWNFGGRPVSRIDEQSENSVHDSLRSPADDLSVVPVEDYDELPAMLPQPSGVDTTYSFHLNPLADFTVNQNDESMKLEMSYVAQRTHPTSLRQIHGTFALATEELVKHITDVEPFEVYWDQLRRLDLRGKSLITVHKLNEFCPRLEELDLSDNSIGQIGGVPWSVRCLKIQRNCLSSLTAWSHLSNLQYLDVSGNDLENLDAFSGLIHLRSLRANNNKISNINGILELNGLLSLKVRNNLVQSVDFAGAELDRLTELDLRGNQITNVENVANLGALESLDLRDNRIQHLEPARLLQRLCALKLSNNLLETLDVASFPALHTLYLDRNHLTTVTRLEHCSSLDTLSLREQTSPSATYPATHWLPAVQLDLQSAASLRKLFLSCNNLSKDVLSTCTVLPNLQFLDLASCSLQELPSEFGRMFPNLAALNLNFNALSDIAGLQGITRLGRLSLVGNRISRLRKLCQILRSVGGRNGSLTKIDLRGNPINVGFYPPPISGSGRSWADKPRGLLTQAKNSATKHSDNEVVKSRVDMSLPTFGGCADIAVQSPDTLDDNEQEAENHAVEIDDPYTLPLADPAADQKYLIRLDEATKLKRKVVELMVQAATSGRLKSLDGLDVEGGGEGRIRKDETWRRLEELGILRKKDVA